MTITNVVDNAVVCHQEAGRHDFGTPLCDHWVFLLQGIVFKVLVFCKAAWLPLG